MGGERGDRGVEVHVGADVGADGGCVGRGWVREYVGVGDEGLVFVAGQYRKAREDVEICSWEEE